MCYSPPSLSSSSCSSSSSTSSSSSSSSSPSCPPSPPAPFPLSSDVSVSPLASASSSEPLAAAPAAACASPAPLWLSALCPSPLGTSTVSSAGSASPAVFFALRWWSKQNHYCGVVMCYHTPINTILLLWSVLLFPTTLVPPLMSGKAWCTLCCNRPTLAIGLSHQMEP